AGRNKGKDQVRRATGATWKDPVRSWLAKAETQVAVTMAGISANYTFPLIASPPNARTDDSWTATSTTSAPSGRFLHTAVWTGSEMIVWGGEDDISHFNTGGRYNPSTDSWTATSATNAPDGRAYHTAVWTGSQMIVWGGSPDDGQTLLNTGGRYCAQTPPCTDDTWIATSTTSAHPTRYLHTAHWP